MKRMDFFENASFKSYGGLLHELSMYKGRSDDFFSIKVVCSLEAIQIKGKTVTLNSILCSTVNHRENIALWLENIALLCQLGKI